MPSAAALLDNFAGLNVVYTSSERFMNEMISSIKLDRMPLFHRHYRSADVLLIDDIQIIAGKNGTQEEFFHTFNELYDHRKQIVLSSDRRPANCPAWWNACARASSGGCWWMCRHPIWKRKWRFWIRKRNRKVSLCRRMCVFSSPPKPRRMCANWKARSPA